MKKLLILFSIIVCICAFSSCEHSHKAGEEYKSDEKYHWLPCTDSECDEKLEKAEHTWGKGEVTTKPTVTQDGTMSYLCTVCKRLRQEPIKHDPVSTVSREQWENAFLLERFYNVTAQIVEEIKSEESTAKWVYDIEANGSVIYVRITEYRNDSEIGYHAKFQDGILTWNFTSKEQKIEDVSPESSFDVMEPTAVLTDHGFNYLVNLFDSFSYNETTKCYEATNVKTADMKIGFKKISVSLGDGQVTEIIAATEDNPEMSIKITYSKYSQTTPTPPTGEEKK